MSASVARAIGCWQNDLFVQYQFTSDELPDSQYLVAVSPSMIHGLAGHSLRGSESGSLWVDTRSPWQGFSVRGGDSVKLWHLHGIMELISVFSTFSV